MNELDGDDIRISSRGVPAERDIVQFVPFREFVRPGVDLSVSQVTATAFVIVIVADVGLGGYNLIQFFFVYFVFSFFLVFPPSFLFVL